MFAVMSYNVLHRSDETRPWYDRVDAIASTIRYHHPAVVGLQEADPTQLADLAMRLPDYTWLDAGRGTKDAIGESASIGYRSAHVEVLDDGTEWLCERDDCAGEPGWDAVHPRLVRWARFRDTVTGAEFTHFNTHFDHAGERAREESALTLGEHVDRCDTPAIITADLNAEPEETPPRTLRDLGLHDARHASMAAPHGPRATMTTREFTGINHDRRIDYVWTTHDVDVHAHAVLTNATAAGEFPSDHFPVVARVEVPA